MECNATFTEFLEIFFLVFKEEEQQLIIGRLCVVARRLLCDLKKYDN